MSQGAAEPKCQHLKNETVLMCHVFESVCMYAVCMYVAPREL